MDIDISNVKSHSFEASADLTDVPPLMEVSQEDVTTENDSVVELSDVEVAVGLGSAHSEFEDSPREFYNSTASKKIEDSENTIPIRCKARWGPSSKQLGGRKKVNITVTDKLLLVTKSADSEQIHDGNTFFLLLDWCTAKQVSSKPKCVELVSLKGPVGKKYNHRNEFHMKLDFKSADESSKWFKLVAQKIAQNFEMNVCGSQPALRQLSSVQDLLSRLHAKHPTCANENCQEPSPTWACLNTHVLLCVQCAGHARSIPGAKVRSVLMDTCWDEETLALFITQS